jgi:protein-disulfide isomerase
MRTRLIAAFAALGLTLAAGPSWAQTDKPAFTPEQEARLKQLMKEYILANPELLLEAIQTLRRKQEEQAQRQAQEALKTQRDQLQGAKDLPVAGNPNGNITVVEFFDYRCGYCKAVKPTFDEVVKADGNIRVVFKEFPILGPASRTASLAAIAAHRQGKYLAYHNALMAYPNNLNDDVIFTIARQVGLDVAKLKQDMNDASVKDVIERSHKVAELLGIRGTPAFVIGAEIVPGAIGADEFKQRIAAAREACKAKNEAVC